jgi:hypothetical protein
MSLILLNRIYKFTDDGFDAKLEMMQVDEIKEARPWRLKGKLSEEYPKDFTLITKKDGTLLKVAQDIELFYERINGLKGTEDGNKSQEA